MNTTAIKLLEYDKIKEKLAEYAVSEYGKERVKRLEPSVDIRTIEGWMKETTEAGAVIARNSSVPIDSMAGLDRVMGKLGKGGVLYPEELYVLFRLLESVKRLKSFMGARREAAPSISAYAASMYELPDLAGEIDRCIRNGRIDDKASPELSKVRKRIVILEGRITGKLESILKSPANSAYLQDSMVSIKNGVYVIPVKREHRKNFEGSVVDTSASGSTVFIEPEGVRRLREELSLARLEQEKEEYRILSYLTGLAEDCRRELSINVEAMAHYDFIFAKAKYGKALDGKSVALDPDYCMDIRGARHPLLGQGAVPLNLRIGNGYRALIVTGPNTGGKTVALKTAGLLAMMAQSGLHVPVEEGSRLAVFRDVLVDIGDGQSIEQSLSTFSSHIRNIISIMACADPHTLVIIDELGTGTDPAEGTGLAISVLEEIFAKGATMLVTTHYSELKEFASQRAGFQNGCMEFDVNTLKPLYRLKIGQPGESNAFLIALKLGMDRRVIERAHEITYREKKAYDGVCTGADMHAVQDEEVIRDHESQVKKVERTLETRKKIERQKIEPSFAPGDCVYISTMNRTGIVCEQENNKGEVTVMVMKKKFKVNKKRLSLYVEGKELYPEDYDFDIVFESKENRKKRHRMEKGHVEGLTIETVKK